MLPTFMCKINNIKKFCMMTKVQIASRKLFLENRILNRKREMFKNHAKYHCNDVIMYCISKLTFCMLIQQVHWSFKFNIVDSA